MGYGSDPARATAGARGAERRMRFSVLVALGWLVCVGCTAGEASGPPPVSAAPPSEVVVFVREGIPGPWARKGTTREDFERELRECRDRSSDARASAENGDGADLAYRTFLDCMRAFRWTRGFQPADAPKAPAA
jgi:hypothetical protein